MPQPVERDLPDELGDDLRLLRPRPHHGQVTAQDVHDLGQLVEMGAAKQTTEGGHPDVVLGVQSLFSSERHARIVRNLRISNVVPFRPIRGWR